MDICQTYELLSALVLSYVFRRLFRIVCDGLVFCVGST